MKSIETVPIQIPWGLREIKLAIVALLCLFGALRLFAPVFPENPTNLILIMGLLLYSPMIGLAIGMGPGRDIRRLTLLGLGYPQKSLIFWGLIGAFLSMGFTRIYVYLIEIAGPGELMPPPLPELINPDSPLPLTFIGIVILGPFAEEIFYRGFIFGGLFGRLGPWRAAYVSAGLFAVSHMDFGLIIPAFAAGLLFAWVYNRTGSIWPIILAHSIQNALVLGIAVS